MAGRPLVAAVVAKKPGRDSSWSKVMLALLLDGVSVSGGMRVIIAEPPAQGTVTASSTRSREVSRAGSVSLMKRATLAANRSGSCSCG